MIVKEESESLDKASISKIITESVSKLSKVLGEGKSNLPRLVLSSTKKSSKSVDLVLVLAEMSSHGNKTLNAKNSDLILFILRELSESRH